MAPSNSRLPAPDPDDVSPDTSRAFDALRRLVRAMRAATPDGEGPAASVTNAQLLVLRELGVTPGMSLGELARRTQTTQSTVSEVVTRLVDSGHIRRRVAAADARRRELSLTARGRAAVERAPRSTSERLLAALAAMPPARRRAVAIGLEGWLAAAGLDGGVKLRLDRSDGGHGSRRPG